jgi:hypothetical protein
VKNELRFSGVSPRVLRQQFSLVDEAFRSRFPLSVRERGRPLWLPPQFSVDLPPPARRGENSMKRWIVYTGIAFSILLQGLPKPAWAQIPSAETNAAPAAASLNGVTYVAWKGKNTGAGSVWYSTSNGSAWSPQQPINFAETTEAPALTALGDTLYLAWRGQSTNPTDKIYYSTYPSTACASGGWCSQTSINAETTAAPALASSASTLYVAWTTAQNTIEVASYASGVWNFGLPQPVATPYPGTAPALAVYGNMLFLAWVQEELGTTTCGSSQCFQVKYATFLLSSSAWSPAASTTASSSVPVAPALGVYATTATGVPLAPLAGLYLAWTPASGALDYADWDDGSWGTPVVVPGLPIPPGPLTPALVSNAAVFDCIGGDSVPTISTYTFSLVYAAPVSGETYDDIYVRQLFTEKEGSCTAPPPCTGPACLQ